MAAISAVVADPMLSVQTMTHWSSPPVWNAWKARRLRPVAPLTEGQEFSSVLWKA